MWQSADSCDCLTFYLYCAFRTKLAEWLASKGKALKRPPISEKSTTFSVKPKPAPQPKTGPKTTVGSQSENVVQTEPVKPTAALKPDNQTNDTEVPDNKTVCSRRSSTIMNSTLDFLDNSDMDLPVDPEIRMESVRTTRETYLWDWLIGRQIDIHWCILAFFNCNFCFVYMHYAVGVELVW